jgi:hypothetical protein
VTASGGAGSVQMIVAAHVAMVSGPGRHVGECSCAVVGLQNSTTWGGHPPRKVPGRSPRPLAAGGHVAGQMPALSAR